MLKTAVYFVALFVVVHGIAIETGPITTGVLTMIIAYLGVWK